MLHGAVELAGLDAGLEAAARTSTREVCGVIRNGHFLFIESVSPKPDTEFAFPRSFRLKPGDIIWHSHPKGPCYPTVADQVGQLAGDHAWAVSGQNAQGVWEHFAWGDQLVPGELIGAQYRHYVRDCWESVRLWYRVKLGTMLKKYPYDDLWWLDGKPNLIFERMLETGFTFSPKGTMDPRPGDLVFMNVNVLPRTVTNHIGVLTENMQLYQHLLNRVSRRDELEPWMNYINGWGRYAA